MHTLVIRLTGPMQAWGVQSRFTVRDTLMEPSKSGVVGLLCSALGRPRDADISDLAALEMGVRVDVEGRLEYDFHTAGREGFLRASGAVERKQVIPSERYYLAGAWFTVGLGGDHTLLSELEDRLQNPKWLPALGRKAFPPGLPVYIPGGLRSGAPAEVLPTFEDPWWQQGYGNYSQPSRRLVLEGETAGPEGWELVARPTRPDQPLSFAPRRFGLRQVSVYMYQPTLEDVQ